MPKKPQQQAESNSHALSREDRKNEQICRMIERAEKLRLKKEQKKKLAVSAPTRLLWAVRMSCRFDRVGKVKRLVQIQTTQVF